VRLLESGDGAGVHHVLVHAHQAADVASGHVLDGLHLAAHHEDGAMDGLLLEVLLLAGHEVGAQNASLLASHHLNT
jgi:hypothetical protein